MIEIPVLAGGTAAPWVYCGAVETRPHGAGHGTEHVEHPDGLPGTASCAPEMIHDSGSLSPTFKHKVYFTHGHSEGLDSQKALGGSPLGAKLPSTDSCGCDPEGQNYLNIKGSLLPLRSLAPK